MPSDPLDLGTGPLRFDERPSNQRLERIAAFMHKQWAHWTRYTIDSWSDENVQRWERQIALDYSQLTRREQESDLEWAVKFDRELGTAQVAPVCADLTDRTGHASQSDGSTPSPAGPIELGADAPPEILAAREHGRVDMAYKLARASDEQVMETWALMLHLLEPTTTGPQGLRTFVRELCKIVREQPEPEEPKS